MFLQEGDKVYVTKEEEGVCLGVWNNCFGRFPRDILKPLSTDEVVEWGKGRGGGNSSLVLSYLLIFDFPM